MHITEFRTRTHRFPNWKEWAYWVAAWSSAGVGLWLVYGWSLGFELRGVSFWVVFILIASVFLVVAAVVAIILFMYLTLHVSGFWEAELRGITRAGSDGSIVLESTLDGHELARCKPGCKKKIVVGMGRFEQTWRCEMRSVNAEPVTASLYCEDSVGDGSLWIALFSMTHDRQDVVVRVNEEDLRFPYLKRPDYLKIAGRVASSFPEFAELGVIDASAK